MSVKFHFINRLGIVFLFIFSQAIAQSIVGSAHDFTSGTNTWYNSDEICIACHTPHNADLTIIDAPLWNHELSDAVYTVYSSPTMDVPVGQPLATSKLCLSCHDGTIALDSFGGNTGTTLMTGDANVGDDLSDDHPISIDWQHQTETPECSNCHDMTQTPSMISPLPFFDGNVECATCHDVHAGSGASNLLRISNTGSDLCFYCHAK